MPINWALIAGRLPLISKRSWVARASVSDQMGGGIEFLFKKNKVDYVVGKGMVHAAGMVEITEGESKGTYLKAEKIMIATGCKPRKVDEVEVDGKRVMTSREALAMTEQPQSIAIMGAGAIGAEFAYFLNAFGTKGNPDRDVAEHTAC